ncbi:hypothetical protein AAG570_000253 [Ranatra chinensis]|uniref:Uncharacterized protein n=1 Tax=Ranatra chinensis TaxID=642074 RepID=A0ABD0YWI5_9HEMI
MQELQENTEIGHVQDNHLKKLWYRIHQMISQGHFEHNIKDNLSLATLMFSYEGNPFVDVQPKVVDMAGWRNKDVVKLNGGTGLSFKREGLMNAFGLVDTDSPSFVPRMEVVMMVLKGFGYGKKVGMGC